MKINFVFLLLQIFLETYLIPNLSLNFINPKLFLIGKYILNAFLVTKELKTNKHKIFYVFLLLTLDGIVGKVLVNCYYADMPQIDLPLILLTYYTAGFALSFLKNSDFEKFNSSEMNSAITKFICSFVFSNVFTNFLMNNHSNTVKNFQFSFEYAFFYLEIFLVDFLIVFGVGSCCHVIKYFNEDVEGIKKILNKNLLKGINYIVFFILINSSLTQIFYDSLFNQISKPYDMFLYKTLAYDNKIRMKICFGIFFNILI